MKDDCKIGATVKTFLNLEELFLINPKAGDK